MEKEPNPQEDEEGDLKRNRVKRTSKTPKMKKKKKKKKKKP